MSLSSAFIIGEEEAAAIISLGRAIMHLHSEIDLCMAVYCIWSLQSCRLIKFMLVNKKPTLKFPAVSINENQSLIAINIINNNQLIGIDWFNQSIENNTHSPTCLNFIDFY